MTVPVTRRRENTRARLLEAAGQVFAEVGLEGASVETICERAGFTRGAFYSNFDSKDELFLELASTVGEQKLETVRARIAECLTAGELNPVGDPVELMRRVMDSGADDRLGVLLTSEIRIRALRDATFAEAYFASEERMLQSITDIIQGIVDAGVLTLRLDVPRAARTLMVLWEGMMVRGAIEGQDGVALQECGSDAIAELLGLLIEYPEPR